MKAPIFRRLICLILCLSMLLCMSNAAFAFNASAWAQDELTAAQEAGIIPDSLADVDMKLKLTRQEMCDIAVHTFEQLTDTSLYPASTNHFLDTADANVNIAYELGIVNGCPDGTFRPNTPITRQEFAQVIMGLFSALNWDENEPILAKFTDHDKISAWAKDSTATVVELGIVYGSNTGQIGPQDNGSREQTLSLMLRTYEFLVAYLGLEVDKTPQESPITEMNIDTADIVQSSFTQDATPHIAQNAPDADITQESASDTAIAGEETIADFADNAASDIEGAQPQNMEKPIDATALQEKTPTYTCSFWAADGMAQMVSYGLIPESLLDADLTQDITRSEICYAAALLYEKITGQPYTPVSTNNFTDTSDPIINGAYELGIVSGYPNGAFGPDDLMTREQLFKIICNVLKRCNWTKPSKYDILCEAFTDANSISAWAYDAMSLMYQLQIMHGSTSGAVAPLDNTTREQGIVMFLRAFYYIAPWYEENPLNSIDGPLVANSLAEAVVELALSYVGYPYVYGGASPQTGFDCSGFTYYIYKQFGYTLNRTAAGQIANGINVERDQLLPGDIIIMSVRGDITTVGHVAIYIGDGKMVHAQSTATGVCITPVSNYNARYITARRIIY